ncbi:MAG: carboxymuconolactone decarboxylase family protein [Solirubrobacteraceae bacterium]
MSYASARRMYGRPLEPTGIVAHHKPLLAGYSALALASDRFSHSVPKRLKELAMLRTAQLVGCEWCLDFGSKLAQDAGVPADDLRDLSTWQSSSRFDRLDRLVLEYAEAMTRTPVEVSDELFDGLRAHFDERQIVELTMAIGLENLYARTNWAFGIEGEGFSEGMYCVRPENASAEAFQTAGAARSQDLIDVESLEVARRRLGGRRID